MADLPDEILSYVFQFITDARDLINSACVSWRFKNASEPHLYREVEVLEEHQAVRLSAAIKAKDLRAKWIHSFLLSPSFGHHIGLRELPSNIRQMRNLRSLRLETPDLNRQQSRARRPWIELQERYERIFEFSSILVSNPSDRELPFLTECTLHFIDSRTELYGLSHYSALFLHPNLRSLTISCASSDLPEELLPGIPDDRFLQRQTSLTHLHLEECDLNAGTLAKILRYPRALKSLTISEGTRYTPLNNYAERRHGDLYPADLVLALNEQAGSLETLSLSLGYIRSRFATINTHGEHLDLGSFGALRTLELCHRTLHLVRTAPNCDHGLRRRLPPGLQKLTIFEIPMGLARMPMRTHLQPAYIPFHPCVFRKSECGMPSLQELVLKYVLYGQDDDAGADAEDDVQPAQLLQAKELLKARARTFMVDMKKSGMSLRIDQVNLPIGFIPPYLVKETKPQEALLWDSRLEPLPVQ